MIDALKREKREHMSKLIQGVQIYWGAQVLRAERLPSLLKWAGGKEQELRYILPMIPPFRRYYEPFVGGGAIFFSIQTEMKFINDKSTELINLYRMVAEQNAGFFQTLNGLLYQWQRMSQFVDSHALELLNMYKAYAMGECSSGKMREILFEFVLCHTEDFQDMFAGYLEKNSENFLREIQRNLVSKTTRMKQLERKKGKLPESDVVANMESALKSAFYMHLKKYLVSFQDRNNRESEHLMITNYDQEPYLTLWNELETRVSS